MAASNKSKMDFCETLIRTALKPLLFWGENNALLPLIFYLQIFYFLAIFECANLNLDSLSTEIIIKINYSSRLFNKWGKIISMWVTKMGQLRWIKFQICATRWLFCNSEDDSVPWVYFISLRNLAVSKLWEKQARYKYFWQST